MLLSLIGLALVLFGTTPQRIGPFGITLFFLLVLLNLFALTMLLRSIVAPNSRIVLIIGVVLSLSLVSGLVLNIVNLGVGDVVLLSVLSATVVFYLYRLLQPLD